jgi:cyanophycin synthetase
MKIVDIQVMRGPNIWSNYRQRLIVLRLDLEELETRPTHRIEGFADRIRELMPTLFGHRCSEGHKGGFFQRVEQGTWMGHVIEHIALELQSLTGMPCGYGRTRSTDEKGVYNVVFAYRIEEAGIYAATAAVQIAAELIGSRRSSLPEHLARLEKIRKKHAHEAATAALIEEALLRDIPISEEPRNSLLLGYGKFIRRTKGLLPSTTRGIGMEICGDFAEMRQVLGMAHIPLTEARQVQDAQEAERFALELGFPLRVRPACSSLLKGLTRPVRNLSELGAAYRAANAQCPDVIIGKPGKSGEYIIAVIGCRVAAAIKPDAERSTNTHDDNKDIAGTDPSTTDVTDDLPASITTLAGRAALQLDLDVCTVHIEYSGEDNATVTAIYPGADFNLFIRPSSGLPRNLARPLLQMLFPGNTEGRVPLTAVAGGKGEALCIFLLAKIAEARNVQTGRCGSEGIFIDGHKISTEESGDAASATIVLQDPSVEEAIIGCSVAGILESGLAFDTSDVCIIPGISDDERLDADFTRRRDIAKIKMVIAQTLPASGWVILNAGEEFTSRAVSSIAGRLTSAATPANKDFVTIAMQAESEPAWKKTGS